ncbi:unnamed protein product [Clavelina lepadiformis]|uniref:Uncharacterized protein n=1 Tax=Clavelina lepadiformis TaxID=159417 RepID=A0ABP0EWU5_CLALP
MTTRASTYDPEPSANKECLQRSTLRRKTDNSIDYKKLNLADVMDIDGNNNLQLKFYDFNKQSGAIGACSERQLADDHKFRNGSGITIHD